VKHGELRSIAHNLADSFASGIGLPIGHDATDVFGEAEKTPEGFIAVRGRTAPGWKLEPPAPLSSLGHDQPKNVINARRIAGAVLLKPFEYVRVKTHSHQFLRRTPELGELLIGERRNVGIVDSINIPALLSPRNPL